MFKLIKFSSAVTIGLCLGYFFAVGAIAVGGVSQIYGVSILEGALSLGLSKPYTQIDKFALIVPIVMGGTMGLFWQILNWDFDAS